MPRRPRRTIRRETGDAPPCRPRARQGIDRQHLRRRIESDDLAIAKIWIGGTGASAEVENTSRWKVGNRGASPIVVVTQRKDTVEPVVPASDPGEHLPVAHVSRSNPTRGRSTSGTTTEPSDCWPFSRMAMRVRPTATAVPLRVWAIVGSPFAVR